MHDIWKGGDKFMKKVSCMIMALMTAVSLTGCSTFAAVGTSSLPDTAVTDGTDPAESTPIAETEALGTSLVESAAGRKILIAYFTWADNTVVENPSSVDVDATSSASVLPPGNVEQMAYWIQEEVGGDLFSIQVEEPYSSDYDECLNRAADEKADGVHPKLTAAVEDMDDYDVVFLGYPNWWYTVPMALYSFIEENNLAGKKVILFCSHGTGGLASSVQDLTRAMPECEVERNVIGIYRNDIPNAQADIKSWLAEIGY
ncbi:flavodoxin [Enterocloster citroniae]|uniref:Flavodoxin n=5 Tax=Enterocloster citroniae TaxID=358743 RepID=A0AA41FKC4_9FIRM|nr:flavodoxin [Enterocloster citroniae]MCC3387942.1 flavodoxin [Enterocloster citroniae]RGC09886.1 flavodoxin [Enterocloster citroniae]